MQEQSTGDTFSTHGHIRTRHLPDVAILEARGRLRASLLATGWATTTDFDLADFLNRRLDESFESYFVVEACHPRLAKQALDVAWDGGLLMPTRFCVWKAGQGSIIATLEPVRQAEAIGLAHLLEVAVRIEERLDRVFEKLDEPAPASLASDVPVVTELQLTGSERATLREAAKRQLQEMLGEAARTESRPLQHRIAQAIDNLEQAVRKLEATAP